MNMRGFNEGFIPFNEYTPVRISGILNGILLNYASNEILNDFDSNVIFTNYEIQLAVCNETSKQIECSICYNTTDKVNCVYFDCNHEYCFDCVKQLVNNKHKNCPYCRDKIKNITCYTEENYNKLHN